MSDMNSDPDTHLVALSVAHNQAMFEADIQRRQRNGLIAGAAITPFVTGALRGAEVLNDTTIWGPRIVGSFMILGAIERGLEAVGSRKKAHRISRQVALHDEIMS